LSAQGVLRRLLGDRADRFSLVLAKPTEGFDWFEVEARGGDVEVAGSSPVALCRGAYHYLKQACHVQVAWSGDAIRLPDMLPDFDRVSVTCPNRLRYYLSVCTFGYSTVWWDWGRWEREIDWMAVHGINMPLALNGQEFVWQRVFRDLGLTELEIESHFSGPAFLPWHRLGNLNGYMGPLSQSWIEGQAKLQKRILDRERELGMTPVVPGFSGFVPDAIKRIHPEIELHSAEPWAGFPATTYIDPRSDLFVEIGARFIKEYRKAFGAVHHYLCETFAEQIPQIEPNGEIDYLRSIGKATWNSLEKGDPDCHWVMQGWPFYFARDFWSPERAAALFDAVPGERLIVLDQVTEAYEVWRDQPAVREKGWIHSVVHNYGQNTHLHGDLQGFADRAWRAMQDPGRGHMLGVGFVPEGIDQNPVVYELLSDIMWSEDRIDVSSWIEAYALARYGCHSQSALACWSQLAASLYGPAGGSTLRYSWRFRPGDQPLVPRLDVPAVFAAGGNLLDAAPQLGAGRNYRRDLVDVTKTWLGGLADLVLARALASGDREYKDLFFQILLDVDRILATLPEHRLSSWISSARAAGGYEADRFEVNARSLITHWGQPFLFDYATREWAGLTRDFHLERWRLYFDFLEHPSDPSPDFAAWEARWASTIRSEPEGDFEDPIRTARELVDRYSGWVALLADDCRGENPSVFGPLLAFSQSSSRMELVLDLGESQPIRGVAIFPIFGQGFKGVYSGELSVDGLCWTLLAGTGHSACRGARFAFEPESYRFIRFSINREQGEAAQLFQVVIFMR